LNGLQCLEAGFPVAYIRYLEHTEGKRLPGRPRESATMIHTSWEAVYRSLEWGLAHRQLQGVRPLGIEELHWRRDTRAAYIDFVFRRILNLL